MGFQAFLDFILANLQIVDSAYLWRNSADLWRNSAKLRWDSANLVRDSADFRIYTGNQWIHSMVHCPLFIVYCPLLSLYCPPLIFTDYFYQLTVHFPYLLSTPSIQPQTPQKARRQTGSGNFFLLFPFDHPNFKT
ncbi:hypothetical protein SAMN05444673_6451 [Bacillus sp. OV166]|nr:hypothetical protein SAMN05444673_6451 [Bacillus sp. OV166]